MSNLNIPDNKKDQDASFSEREEKFRGVIDMHQNLLERLPDGFYKSTHAGKFIEVNPAMVKMLGYSSKEELMAIDIKTELYFQPEDRESLVLQEKLEEMGIFRLKKKDGTAIWVEDHGWYSLDEQGEIRYHEGILRDVTERKLAEEALKESEERFKMLFEKAPIGYQSLDENACIVDVNETWLETLGYQKEDIIGQWFGNFLATASAREFKKQFSEFKEKGEIHNEFELVHRDGHSVFVLHEGRIGHTSGGEFKQTHCVILDITKQKQNEQKIIQLSKAVEQSPASIIITDISGNIEYVNEKFLATTGYERNQLIGKVLRILKAGHTSDATYVEIWNNLFAGMEWRGEHKNRKKNGEKYWESVLISPIKNNEGRITNYIILSEDISDRKNMEKELIQAKLKAQESDRLKSAFLANMSHEIRTPLNSILGFSDLLTEPKLDEESRQEYASLISSSGSNLLSIINDVLDISKIEAGQITLSVSQFSAQKLINSIKNEYALKARQKEIELQISPETADPEIFLESDEARIKQVLINFVGNALKFTEKGVIEIGVTTTDENIRFYVKDTGIGIPKEFHEKIFDRFRQVEAAHTRKYGGNGLGLAITKNLGELLGGRIWLESEVGNGSVFYFDLPIGYRVC